MTPSLSVIIPTKNRPAALAEVLRSIKAQTVEPDEIIVVDQTPNSGGGQRRPFWRFCLHPLPSITYWTPISAVWPVLATSQSNARMATFFSSLTMT